MPRAKTSHDLTIDLDDVVVTVREAIIREAGWMLTSEEEECVCEAAHCHDDSCDRAPDPTPAVEVVQKWHNENHRYAFQLCDERPCSDLRDAARDWL